MIKGFQILKPYGKIIGHWKEKPISVDVDQKCVACELDAIEVDDRMFDFLLGLDDESAVTAAAFFVREGRNENRNLIFDELVRQHDWKSVSGDCSRATGCTYGGYKVKAFTGNSLEFEKKRRGVAYGFAVPIPHEKLTPSEVRKKVSDILCAVEKCDREIRSVAHAERPRRNPEGE